MDFQRKVQVALVLTVLVGFFSLSADVHGEVPPDVRLLQGEIRTITVNGTVNKTEQRDINSAVEYIFIYKFNSTVNTSYSVYRDLEIPDEDIRIQVSTDSVDTDFPVLFTVRQQHDIMSWPLPITSKFDKKLYQQASRTICGEAALSRRRTESEERTVIVSIFTYSAPTISFNITVWLEQKFLMRLDEENSAEVSPLEPRFYRFVFKESGSRFVLLEVTAEDDSCVTVSVQNATCPVLDQENNVQFEGYWQTMTQNAGMTLRKEDFPNGFYVVFVMHGDNSRCTKTETEEYTVANFDKNLHKKITFVIHEKITDIEYISAIFGTVGIFFAFYVFSFVVSCAHLIRSRPQEIPIEDEGDSENHNSHPSRPYPPLHSSYPADSRDEQPQPHASNQDERLVSANRSDDDTEHWLAGSTDSSLDETDIDMMADAERDKDVYRTSTALCVAALAKKNPRVLDKKSQMYLWTLLTVAVFYGLPVVQLVFTYQKVLHTTGNQDLCYYNYLCSHPLWLLSDFNHVYSNIGYIMLGILFLILVFRKDRMHMKLLCQCPSLETRCGIPRHFGLFYAMGVALIMEGALSACYHVCPNHSNFQFDTCFMYVNAMLLMLKIYQTRHPDINASAYMAFSALAVVVLLGVVGVLAGSKLFWISFTVFHIAVCFYITIQVYYLGRWRLDCGIMRRVYNTWKNDCIASPLLCLKPLYVDRMVLLLLGNLGNWAIAGYGIYARFSQDEGRAQYDFATHLLLIFMANLFLYSNFYILMKLTHRETITAQPTIYIILSVTFWALAMYVFVHKSTSWQMTPAESRTYNRECLLLRFYDTHDVWHFLSAASMFFSFMILLTLDDDLIFVPRTKIPVF